MKRHIRFNIRPKTIGEKLEFNIFPVPECGCWLWTGADNAGPMGYGRFKFKGVDHKAHRASWEFHKGPIPEGMWVLHKCNTPLCVNPNHLYLGTSLDNNRDTVRHKRHKNSRKTHCKRGHPLSGDNLKIVDLGRRKCAICARMLDRRRGKRDLAKRNVTRNLWRAKRRLSGLVAS